MSSIPRFFIDRPIFATVISILTLVAGAVAWAFLPVAQYPNITPPTVSVTASYPGANAETIANTVAAPLEQQINGVDDMIYIASSSTSDGQMSITVTFKPGTDPDKAQVLVQNRVQSAIPRLPETVRNNGVVVRKRSPDFTMAVSIISPDESRDDLYLSNYAYLQISDYLTRIPGVGDILLFGAREYSMRIWLNPESIAALNMTPGDVIAALREQNVQIPAGSVGAQPSPAGLDFQMTVTTQGRLQTTEEFENIVIKTGDDGEIVTVKDVARVELGAKDYTVISRLDGKPAINIGVFQAPGSNALEVSKNIRAEMERLSERFPPGVEYKVIYDTTMFVQEAITSVLHTILEAFILVLLVVMIFLQSWRSTLIPILAVPVSLIGALAILLGFGFSLNLLTLLGLVLAIGIVVDDAIVVVEAVEHHLESGMGRRAATIKAMEEVSGPIVAMSVVLVAVFVPTAFISGLTGSFYRQFALTIAFSTILSMVNSLTLSPALCALFLQGPKEKKDVFGRFIEFAFGWFFRLFNKGFEASRTGYLAVVRKAIRWKYVSLAIYAALLALTFFMFQKVPTGFIPQTDQGVMFVNVELPEGASIERTTEVMDKVEKVLSSTPGIAHTMNRIGSSSVTQATAPNTGTVICIFESFEDRVGVEGKSLESIVGHVTREFAKIKEARVLAFPAPAIRGLGRTGGVKMMIQDREGGSPTRLENTVNQLVSKGAEKSDFEKIFSLYRAKTPQLYIDINRTQAKSMDVPIKNISEALQIYLGSIYVNDLNLYGKPFQVTAQAEGKYRARAENILALRTRSNSGNMVPLGSLMEVSQISAPSRIQRYNLFPAADLSASSAPGFSSGQTIASMEKLADETLPRAYGYEWTDSAFQEIAAGNSAAYVFPICLFVVFMVLAALYESWRLPIAIILIVPLCVLCALVGISIAGGDNNIFTQVGFIVLIGLAAKNSILVVEYAKLIEDRDGLSPMEAAIEASRLRLRPILMTALAFILGVLPLVIATGAGAELRKALGIAVFAGMLGVTFAGLFLTPVFYAVIRSIGRKKENPQPS